MSGCCVLGCHNRYSNSGLKFYRIPTGSRPFQSNRRRLWLRAIKRVDDHWTEDTIKNARVCSAHFISGEASTDSSSPDFVPSVFVYTKQRQKAEARRERKRRRVDMVNTQTSQPTPEEECSRDRCPPAEEDSTVPGGDYDDLNLRHSQLQEEYINLRQDCDTLRAAIVLLCLKNSMRDASCNVKKQQ